MCERYVIPDQADVEQEFDLDRCWWRFSASFNVGTQRNVPVIRVHRGEAEGVMMRWGLIPAAAEGDASKESATYASMEDLGQAKLFRDAWWRGQRCILPLAGFYVWQLTDGGYRQPYFVRLVNRSVFGVAAVWDRSVARDEDDIMESCALITVPSNPLLAEIDNTSQRMPAILHRNDYHAWLTAQPTDARALLDTYPQERMVSHAVSPRVNSPKYDDQWLIRPISPARVQTQHHMR
jgi:putative SOS response-associated peptidase YedK